MVLCGVYKIIYNLKVLPVARAALKASKELEKEMATHSSILAWRIPGTEEPGGLPPMGSHRVGHD